MPRRNLVKTRSLDYELRTGKGQSWGAVIGAVVEGTKAYINKRQNDKARRDEEEQERRARHKAKRFAEEDRVTMSRVAQSNLSSSTGLPEKASFNPSLQTIALIGAGVLLFILVRK